MELKGKLLKSEVAHKGAFLTFETCTFELCDKSIALRDIIRHPGACAIITLDDKNNILLERQYREALDEVLIEIPAGKIDPGEDIKTCAIRELEEETGYLANDVTFLTKIALAPGYSDEVVHFFLAKDLVATSTNLDEGEHIEIFKLPLKEAKELVLSGEIKNSVSAIGILFICSKMGI